MYLVNSFCLGVCLYSFVFTFLFLIIFTFCSIFSPHFV